MAAEKKSVLFICPAFFGYETSITNAIKSNGFDVDFFDERTSNKSYYKAIFRIRKSLLNQIIDKYYRQIFEQIKQKKYAYFFLIKGEVIPEWFIIKFKENNPEAKLVYYTYDSINNNNNHSVNILKYFDDCFSFDFEDIKIHPTFKLKHLFYTNEYVSQQNNNVERKYDLSFVGTLHSNRYNVIKTIAAGLQNTFIFYYMPAKWFFYFNKMLKKDYRKISASEISFKKINKAEVAGIFKSSKSVLDIQRFGQTGLTMRTFEVLASKSILVTTNTYVKQADFYNPDRIIVLDDFNDPDNIDKIRAHINNTQIFDQPLDKGFEKYFVENWVSEFFQ